MTRMLRMNADIISLAYQKQSAFIRCIRVIRVPFSKMLYH